MISRLRYSVVPPGDDVVAKRLKRKEAFLAVPPFWCLQNADADATGQIARRGSAQPRPVIGRSCLPGCTMTTRLAGGGLQTGRPQSSDIQYGIWYLNLLTYLLAVTSCAERGPAFQSAVAKIHVHHILRRILKGSAPPSVRKVRRRPERADADRIRGTCLWNNLRQLRRWGMS